MTYMGLARLAVATAVGAAAVPALVARAAGAKSVETIVFVRHGEKPEAGLGQLSCQGLNRALALPAVIRAKFGRPDAIFAPDPSGLKTEWGRDDEGEAGGGREYSYVRPLATIEPSAVAFGLPVNAQIKFEDVAGLQAALLRPEYEGALVVVAWEHREILAAARGLAKAFRYDAGRIPEWGGADFDSVYVVRITHGDGGTRMSFSTAKEGLDGRSEACPVD
jgi:hypothetical protein